MERLRIDPATRVLVLTGAGISAESGIATYRGATRDTSFSEEERERLSTPQGLHGDPKRFWAYFSPRRTALLQARPNAGHHALAELERRLGERFLLATQNIDGLHARAGSQRIVEMHGNLLRTRCTRCTRPPFDDPQGYDAVPLCELCLAAGRSGDLQGEPILRPDVVLFRELLARDHLRRIQRFIEGGSDGRLVYLAVGTSGTVFPAAELVFDVLRAGGETWLVNAEPAANGEAFDHFIQGSAGAVLPELFGLSAA